MSGDVPLFDRVAVPYDLALPSARRARIAAGLAVADRPVERVIDLAGGPGRATRSLDGGRPLVVDAAAGMTRRARRRGLPVVRGDARWPPVADAAADAVLIVDALHHLPEPKRVVAAAADLLAPGGVLVVVDFDPGTLRGRMLAVAERVVGMQSTFHDPVTVESWCESAGLVPDRPREGWTYVVAAKRESQEPGG